MVLRARVEPNDIEKSHLDDIEMALDEEEKSIKER
jgi:hypothetical protein